MLAGCLGRPQISLGREGHRCKSWEIKADPPSRSQTRNHPVIAYPASGSKLASYSHTLPKRVAHAPKIVN